MLAKTRAELESRAYEMRASVYDIEIMTTYAGIDSWIDVLVVYQLHEPSCFSWEPGEYEILDFYLRNGDEYRRLGPDFLGEAQAEKLLAEIFGETDEDVLRREVRQRREEYLDRKRSA